MEKVAELLKIFIEKHLLPAVISIAGAILLLLAFPADNWIIVKLGSTLFIVLAFCCIFLIVQIIIKFGKSIKSIRENVSENKYYEKQRHKSNQEAIQEINDFVDTLSAQDKKLLLSFVANGNKIYITGKAYHSFDSLLANDNIMNCSSFDGNISSIDVNRYWVDPSLKESYSMGFRTVQGLCQYRIKDALFHNLEVVYKNQGRIGNF